MNLQAQFFEFGWSTRYTFWADGNNLPFAVSKIVAGLILLTAREAVNAFAPLFCEPPS